MTTESDTIQIDRRSASLALYAVIVAILIIAMGYGWLILVGVGIVMLPILVMLVASFIASVSVIPINEALTKRAARPGATAFDKALPKAFLTTLIVLLMAFGGYLFMQAKQQFEINRAITLGLQAQDAFVSMLRLEVARGGPEAGSKLTAKEVNAMFVTAVNGVIKREGDLALEVVHVNGQESRVANKLAKGASITAQYAVEYEPQEYRALEYRFEGLGEEFCRTLLTHFEAQGAANYIALNGTVLKDLRKQVFLAGLKQFEVLEACSSSSPNTLAVRPY